MQKVAEEKKNTGGKSTKKIKSIGVQKKFQGFSKGMQKKRGENHRFIVVIDANLAILASALVFYWSPGVSLGP